MKKYLYLSLWFCMSAFFSLVHAQQFARTDDNQPVILYPDGVWSKVGAAKPQLIKAREAEAKVITSRIQGDTLLLLIMQGKKERWVSEKIQVLETEKLPLSVSFKPDPAKYKTDLKTVYYNVTRICIGTELFEYGYIAPFTVEGPITKYAPLAIEDARAGGYIHNLTFQDAYFAGFTQQRGRFTLEAAKIVCANMYEKIYAYKLKSDF